MFGWHQLPTNYPSFDSAGLLRKIELSRWVQKAFSLEDLSSKPLYFVEKKFFGDEPTWKYYYKQLLPHDQEVHLSPFTFYPKFEFYNGVKYGEMLPKYTTYFANQDIEDKIELFLNEVNIKH